MAETIHQAATEAEREEWRAHPQTQAFLAWLQENRETLKESWANGHLTTESLDGTKQVNAEAIGKCQAFDDVMKYVRGG